MEDLPDVGLYERGRSKYGGLTEGRAPAARCVRGDPLRQHAGDVGHPQRGSSTRSRPRLTLSRGARRPGARRRRRPAATFEFADRRGGRRSQCSLDDEPYSRLHVARTPCRGCTTDNHVCARSVRSTSPTTRQRSCATGTIADRVGRDATGQRSSWRSALTDRRAVRRVPVRRQVRVLHECRLDGGAWETLLGHRRPPTGSAHGDAPVRDASAATPPATSSPVPRAGCGSSTRSHPHTTVAAEPGSGPRRRLPLHVHRRRGRLDVRMRSWTGPSWTVCKSGIVVRRTWRPANTSSGCARSIRRATATRVAVGGVHRARAGAPAATPTEPPPPGEPPPPAEPATQIQPQAPAEPQPPAEPRASDGGSESGGATTGETQPATQPPSSASAAAKSLR